MSKKLRPDDLRKLKQKADEAFAKTDWKKAIDFYREYTQSTAFDARIIQRLGDLYRKTQQTAFAIVEYKRAANHYVQEGYWAKAIALNKVLLELAPADEDVKNQLANMYAKQSEPKTDEPIELSSTANVPFASGITYGNEIDLEAKEDVLDLQEEVSTPIHTLGSPVRDRMKIPLFSTLTPDEFFSILSRLSIRRFPEGALVCEEGDLGHSMFVIAEGIVEVFTRDHRGTRIPLARLTGGQFFGEYSLLTRRSRNASVSAKTEVELLEITAEDLDVIETLHPRIRKVLEAYLQSRLVQTIMAKSSVFHVLTDEERSELSQKMSLRRCKVDEEIMREGQAGEEMYFIKTGSIALSSQHFTGSVRIATLRPGDFFGEMALLSGKPRMATAVAAEETELFCLTRTNAAKVLRKNRDVLVLLQSKMKERSKDTHDTLDSYQEAQNTLSLV